MAKRKRKYYRTKPRFRLIVALSITALLILAATSIAAGFDPDSENKLTAGQQIVVQTGDTLWNIAKAYGPANQDVRKTISDICELNETSADKLRPGQTLWIPENV
jgi:nucleoid-associated protein YgaU